MHYATALSDAQSSILIMHSRSMAAATVKDGLRFPVRIIDTALMSIPSAAATSFNPFALTMPSKRALAGMRSHPSGSGRFTRTGLWAFLRGTTLRLPHVSREVKLFVGLQSFDAA
jgi:hypothetical protein